MSHVVKTGVSANKRQKITVAQRNDIFRLYVQDRDAARRHCVSLGLSPNYAAQIASQRGVVLGKISRNLTDAEKARARRKRPPSDWGDPRWAWEIERGEVRI